ncbi:hypothetical protein [Novosphingobium sp.]|uniref:hypothetical protein n=1 Tax=Novosphingobium sp. TaxID=1874826 RepID=UPI003D1465C1
MLALLPVQLALCGLQTHVSFACVASIGTYQEGPADLTRWLESRLADDAAAQYRWQLTHIDAERWAVVIAHVQGNACSITHVDPAHPGAPMPETLRQAYADFSEGDSMGVAALCDTAVAAVDTGPWLVHHLLRTFDATIQAPRDLAAIRKHHVDCMPEAFAHRQAKVAVPGEGAQHPVLDAAAHAALLNDARQQLYWAQRLRTLGRAAASEQAIVYFNAAAALLSACDASEAVAAAHRAAGETLCNMAQQLFKERRYPEAYAALARGYAHAADKAAQVQSILRHLVLTKFAAMCTLIGGLSKDIAALANDSPPQSKQLREALSQLLVAVKDREGVNAHSSRKWLAVRLRGVAASPLTQRLEALVTTLFEAWQQTAFADADIAGDLAARLSDDLADAARNVAVTDYAAKEAALRVAMACVQQSQQIFATWSRAGDNPQLLNELHALDVRRHAALDAYQFSDLPAYHDYQQAWVEHVGLRTCTTETRQVCAMLMRFCVLPTAGEGASSEILHHAQKNFFSDLDVLLRDVGPQLQGAPHFARFNLQVTEAKLVALRRVQVWGRRETTVFQQVMSEHKTSLERRRNAQITALGASPRDDARPMTLDWDKFEVGGRGAVDKWLAKRRADYDAFCHGRCDTPQRRDLLRGGRVRAAAAGRAGHGRRRCPCAAAAL